MAKRKKQLTSFVPLNKNDYLFNSDKTHCPVPIFNYMKMLYDLQNVFEEYCSVNDEVNMEAVKQQYQELEDDFINDTIVPIEAFDDNNQSSDNLRIRPVDRAKTEFFNNVQQYDPEQKCRTTIQSYAHNKPMMYYCRDKVEDVDQYDSLIQTWESNWRHAISEELAETWLWNEDKTPIFATHILCTGKLMPTSVTIPKWMYACETFNEVEFHLSGIHKVALAHAIHFTLQHYPYGYMECSGNVELWCRSDVMTVHDAFIDLFINDLVSYVYIPPEDCHGLSRNYGWIANLPKITTILKNYGRWLTT